MPIMFWSRIAAFEKRASIPGQPDSGKFPEVKTVVTKLGSH
jgi:hypothetical protein